MDSTSTPSGPRRESEIPGGLSRPGLGRELLAFGAIGVVSTLAYAALYLALRGVSGPTAANAAALVLTAVGNTAANRRLTFGVRGGGTMVRHQLGGLLALAVALAITTASVGLLGALDPRAGRLTELAVLVAANALATLARFVLLRSLIAGHTTPRPVHEAASAADPVPGVTR